MSDKTHLAAIINIAALRTRKDAQDNPDHDPPPTTPPKGGRGQKIRADKLDLTASFQGRSLAA